MYFNYALNSILSIIITTYRTYSASANLSCVHHTYFGTFGCLISQGRDLDNVRITFNILLGSTSIFHYSFIHMLSSNVVVQNILICFRNVPSSQGSLFKNPTFLKTKRVKECVCGDDDNELRTTHRTKIGE